MRFLFGFSPLSRAASAFAASFSSSCGEMRLRNPLMPLVTSRRGVEFARAVGDPLVHRDAARSRGLGDLVADRVHDHRRVVEPVGDEGLEVALPPLGEVEAVVVADLGAEPGVGQLVHDEHPVPVARAQQGAGCRVVGAADRVVAALLEDADAAVVRGVEGVRADDAVVVVDAGAAELDRRAVDAQAAACVDRDRCGCRSPPRRCRSATRRPIDSTAAR